MSRSVGSATRLAGGQVQRREAKQDRSAVRQRLVTHGAIQAISNHGIAGVTHRRVAQEAGVSLAATTYYYETKADIIVDASRALLARYVDAFHSFIDRHRGEPQPTTLREFAMRLVFNAIGKHGAGTQAWCEIILNTAHQESLRALSRSWFETLGDLWREIALMLGAPDVEQAARSAIDTVMGFLFLVAPLGLSEAEVQELLSRGAVAPAADEAPAAATSVRSGRKAEETRERIIEAAVDLLITEGGQALTFRRIAERTGMALAAPAYYFSSMSTLLNAAQMRLFGKAKARYRLVRGELDYQRLDIEQLIDLTSTVFVREAAEARDLSLACYPVYIQSRRDPSLRPGLSAINGEQWHRWQQVLSRVMSDAQPFDAWVMYALFTGKLIRILATGVDTQALARARAEFAYDLRAMAEGRHWASAK